MPDHIPDAIKKADPATKAAQEVLYRMGEPVDDPIRDVLADIIRRECDQEIDALRWQLKAAYRQIRAYEDRCERLEKALDEINIIINETSGEGDHGQD